MRRIIPIVMGAGLLVGLMMPTGLAVEREPLTLTEVSGWVPEAQLDVSQVETPAMPEPTDLEFGETLGKGWTPLFDDPTETLPDADGIEHADCWINVGDTSVIACADGHTEIS